MKTSNGHKHTNFTIETITYYFSLPFIYLLSSLPFTVLYLFSDFLYTIIFHLVGYRKVVVSQNLRNAFPGKTDDEIKAISRQFYHNLCDLFVETVKMLTIPKQDLLDRCNFTPEAHSLLSKFSDQNKSVLLVMGHNGNWEWSCNAFNILSRHQLFVIYHPITNKHFDGLMYRIRSRFDAIPIAMKSAYKEMVLHKSGLNATAFVADQAPSPEHAYWTTFLHQDTPVFKGMEVIAKRMNLPVLYTSVKRIKRGHYEMTAELLEEHQGGDIDGGLSEMFIRRLEKDIIDQPETWLWSHRRWKHKRLQYIQAK